MTDNEHIVKTTRKWTDPTGTEWKMREEEGEWIGIYIREDGADGWEPYVDWPTVEYEKCDDDQQSE